MDILEQIIAVSGELTFAVLFVALLYYVMKTNEKREEQYRNTITNLSVALSKYEGLKESVDKIGEKLNQIAREK